MATQYPFTLPGHENHTFAFQPDGFTAKIFMDGQVMKQKNRKFRGKLLSGEEIEMGLKYSMDIFSPKITYKGQVLTVIPPLPKSQMLLIYAPLLLVVSGGAVGGLFGAIGTYVNNSIMRGNSARLAKVIFCLLSSLAAFFFFAISAGLIQSSIK